MVVVRLSLATSTAAWVSWVLELTHRELYAEAIAVTGSESKGFRRGKDGKNRGSDIAGVGIRLIIFAVEVAGVGDLWCRGDSGPGGRRRGR